MPLHTGGACVLWGHSHFTHPPLNRFGIGDYFEGVMAKTLLFFLNVLSNRFVPENSSHV
jgi:hypothetical protein